MRIVGSFLFLLLWGSVAVAAPAAETRALVVAGLGGTPEFEADFRQRAKAAADALRDVTSDVALMLGETVSRQGVHDAIRRAGERAAEDNVLVIMLVGHGTYDERDYRFNVPGTDVTGSDLQAWLSALPIRRQLVVAATSASGALQSVLAGGGRTVITATKSGGESNATVFHRYFADALAVAAADLDKDGHISAAEAFDYASAQVAGHYEQRRQMATEHPVMEGPAPGVVLARLGSTRALEAAGTADRERIAALEAEIAALRADKANREPDAYYAQLQRLMLEVALLRRRGESER